MALPPVSGTYNAGTDLSLGGIPQVDDPELYRELLDIHNAIEALLSSSEGGLLAFLLKYRGFSASPVLSDYTTLTTDGTIRVDASAGDITITLHPIAEGVGFHHDIKRIDDTPASSANTVTIIGSGAELIDSHAAGVNLSQLSSYTIKTNDTGWDII